MSSQLVVILSVIFGAGGIAGAVIAFIKVQPETSRVIIDSAEGAVVVQAGVITDLRNEIARLAADLRAERESCDDRIADLQRQIDAKNGELEELRVMVRAIGDRRSDHSKPGEKIT